MTMNPFGSPLVRGGASVPAPSSRYILPQFEERTSYGYEAPRPLHQAVRGPHHLPRRPGRRRVGGRRHRPAASCWSRQDPDRDILMYINCPGGSFTAMTAIYDTMQYIRPDIQTVRRRPGRLGGRGALGAGARASGSRCRTRGSSSTSPRWAAVTTARRPTSRSRPTRSSACAPGSRRRWPSHSGRDPGAGQQGHRARQDPVGGGGQGVRPDRRGAAVPQELAVELTIGSTARRSSAAPRSVGALRSSGIAVRPPCR